MIERRAMLSRALSFESGKKLKRGTVIYVEETEEGLWIGCHYDGLSGSFFSLDAEDFSILRTSDIGAEYLVVMPDPPNPPEEIRRRRQLERSGLRAKIRKHREAADKLEALLVEMTDG